MAAMLSDERKQELDALCRAFRRDLIDTLYGVQSGHPGGSLSVCEILAALYLEKADVTPQNFDSRDRDKVVLSKGHAAPMLYRVLAEAGFFPREEFKTLRRPGTRLQGHPSVKNLRGVDITTGPLGCGYAAALGLALADKLDNRRRYVYAVLGDGEINEGIIWETCLNAAKNNAYRLITILDNNGLQLDGPTAAIMPTGDIGAKFAAFGYNVIHADGHDVRSLCAAIDKAKALDDRPSVIIAKTVKGKGVPAMENNPAWHGAPIDEATYLAAKAELEVAL